MFKPFFFEFEFLKCIFFILSLSHAAAAPNSYFAEIPNGISNMCLLFYAFGSNSAHFSPFLSEAIYSAYTPLPLFDENQQQNLRSRSMPKLFETSSSYKNQLFQTHDSNIYGQNVGNLWMFIHMFHMCTYMRWIYVLCMKYEHYVIQHKSIMTWFT